MTRREDELTEALLSEQCQPGEVLDEAQPSISRNIPYTLWYNGLAFASRAVWNQSVLATYVYLIVNDKPEAVGYISGVTGIASLITSFPAGYISDKYRRDTMLKIGCLVGIIAMFATSWAVYYDSYELLVPALAIWGVCWGIANTCQAAIFADSIKDGERTKYFTQRSLTIQLANTVGPLVSLLLFSYLGNQWTVGACAGVMLAGQVISFPSLVILCFFSDDDTPSQDSCPRQGSEVGAREALLESSTQAQIGGDLMEEQHAEASFSGPLCGLSESRTIAVLIAAADIISGLASGMSMRYFPIFFYKNLNMNPVMVQVLYAIGPIHQAIMMKVGEWLAGKFGRCQVSIAHKWAGACCTFLLILSYIAGLPVWIICVFFIFRKGFYESTRALTKSVLMDNVPKHERGRWSALESVNRFSWSGSAVVGGFLVAEEGILFNFTITALLQVLSTLALVLLVCKVDVEKSSQRRPALRSVQSTSTSEEEGDKEDGAP